MESLLIALNAVVPFFIYLAIGMISRAVGWATEDFLSRLNTFAFRVFFPVLLFNSVYQVQTDFAINWGFVAFSMGSVLVVIAVSMAVVPRFVANNPRRGALVHALYRSNIVIFVYPLALSVYDDAALIPMATLVAFVATLYNVAGVIIMEHYRGASASSAVLVRAIFKNPLIIGLLVGLAFHVLHIQLPSYVEAPVSTIASMATPVALISMGGILHARETMANIKPIAAVVIIKMMILPVVIYLIALQLPFAPVERFLLMAMYAAPVATVTFTLAATMDGDAPLAGELVAVSTVVSMVTLFTWIVALGSLGLLL